MNDKFINLGKVSTARASAIKAVMCSTNDKDEWGTAVLVTNEWFFFVAEDCSKEKAIEQTSELLTRVLEGEDEVSLAG